jgi:hypothetical protein
LQKELTTDLDISQNACRPNDLSIPADARSTADFRISRDHGGIGNQSLIDYTSKVENASIPAYDSPWADVCSLGSECCLLNPAAPVGVVYPILLQQALCWLYPPR